MFNRVSRWSGLVALTWLSTACPSTMEPSEGTPLPGGPVTGLGPAPIEPPVFPSPNPEPDAWIEPMVGDQDGPQIVELSWFQVVEVPVFDSGVEFMPEERTAPLVTGRMALLRTHLSVPTDWTSQEVEVQVEVLTRGYIRTHTTMVELPGTTDILDPGAGIHVEIPAEHVTDDATYRVSVSRVGQSAAADVFPASAAADLGAVDTGPIRVYLVPYVLNGFVPDTSNAVLESYRDEILAMYPTNEVLFELSPTRVSESEDLGGLLVEVGQLIDTQEGPGASYFYYGMATGVADREAFSGVTGSSQELTDRGGFAVGAAFPDARATSTFVHELGHLHQLQHAPCGDPENVDPNFPWVDGSIGIDGYDVRTGTFVESGAVDVMSYCRPRWVSDYHYAKMASWTQVMQAL